MRELLKRVIVAILGIPLFIFSIFQGDMILLSLIILISSLALWEFYKLFEKMGYSPHKYSGIIFNILTVFTFANPFNFKFDIYQLVLIELVFIGLFVIAKELWSKNHKPLINTSSTLAGLIYISLSFSMFYGLRYIFNISNNITFENNFYLNMGININNFEIYSAWIVMITLISIWICDSFAYFVGKSIGKHKIYPKISPKKSWEGTIAGFIGSILSFSIISYFVIPGFPIYHSIILGALAGSIGQIGDLAESQLKREAGVKDSSNILPGHGGILDRFDSIIFVVPVVYIYLSLLKVIF